MDRPKEIKLAYDDFMRLLDTLGYIDTSNFSADFKTEFEYVLYVLQEKKRKIELRDAYSNIVNAKDEDARHDARMEYLRKKNLY